MSQRRRAVTPSARSVEDSQHSRSEKNNRAASQRVPPGLIVAKSFNEEGQPAVEEVFDCRRKRVSEETGFTAVISRQEKSKVRDGGLGTAISRGMQQAGSAIRSLFQRPKEWSSTKDELNG
ncbi:hypothetical protein T440DRAFT_407857 [Plenodomus tracheiphilus IPT5]|uniref:Uncharacterized protein n=1 Tax=Plenodomus tracheiphilus IPT5 TaxID=1408161 RepID=A0A6A7AQ93_9PLEO|nr:hypothetical protein T440DRAFT_407857 [Plenodomus tracheiphilus IPT5]